MHVECTKEIDKPNSHSFIYCMKGTWENWLNLNCDISYNLHSGHYVLKQEIWIMFMNQFKLATIIVFLALGNTHLPGSKVYGANMGPTWVLSAPDGPHVGPTNLAFRVAMWKHNPLSWFIHIAISYSCCGGVGSVMWVILNTKNRYGIRWGGGGEGWCCFNLMIPSYQYMIHITKIRRSHDRLIFMLGIPHLERPFYIESGPGRV